MKFEPLVTIIIPVYNGTVFMGEAIDSALNQTYKNLEIIVINDGSSDNGMTEQKALSYADKITYIHKENGGVSSALNQAIKASHGEYFSWLSHDDLYYPEKIEYEVAFLNRILESDNNADKNRVVIHCATESIDKDGKVIKRPSYKGVDEVETNLKVIIDNVYNYRLSGCSFLLPKAAFEDIGGFREDIRTVSDVDYWYRLLFSDYRFYCLTDDILVKNRSHGKQVGKTKVALFDKELNDLHISIADRLMGDKRYNNPETIKSYYYGLVKRGMKRAAEYTKTVGLKDKISGIDFHFVMPVVCVSYKAKGCFIDVARRVYRKIYVK